MSDHDDVLESVDDLAKAIAQLVAQVKQRTITVGDGLIVINHLIERFESEQKTMTAEKARLLDPVIDFCQAARAVISKQAS